LAVPFTVEGKLSEMNITPDALGAPSQSDNVVCNGTKINLTPTTVYSTPTNAIDLPKLISNTTFPGMDLVPPYKNAGNPSAFIGGTCIIEGDDNGLENGRRATSVFVEVAEHVLVGLVTSYPDTNQPFEIMGVKVVLLAPPTTAATTFYEPEPGGRITAVPVTNATGMKVDISTIPHGDESSAEGYLATLSDGSRIFYAHAVETTGGKPLGGAAGSPIASIQRADLTFSNPTTTKLDIRGGCTFVGTTAPQQIIIQAYRGGAWTNIVSGIADDKVKAIPANCVIDPTGQGTYRHRDDKFPASSASMPTMVRAFVGPAPTKIDPETNKIPEPNYSDNIPLNRIGFK
jgi:hypothetical protein